MRRLPFLVLLILSTIFSALAKKAKTIEVEGYSSVEQERNMSREELERQAEFAAQQNALSKEFGTRVASTDAMHIGDDRTIITTNVISEVKGEWIYTKDVKYDSYINDEGRLVIECKIKGVAREVSPERVDFDAFVLKNGHNLRHVARDGVFYDGDELFIYFKSPVAGFLNIYLLDNEMAYCLLPYRKSTEGNFVIEPDREYIFFSPETDKANRDIIDEYELTADNGVELNTLEIYFSPITYNKGKLNIHQDDISRPKESDLKDFYKWKTKLLSENDQITIKSIPIKIYGKEE